MRHRPEDLEEWQEQSALYALGVLDEPERRAFEEHLAMGCESCAAELQPFEIVVSALALAAPLVAPPAHARARLLASLPTKDAPSPTSQTLSQSSQALSQSSQALSDADAASVPAFAQQFMTLRVDQGEWVEVSAGVFIKQLFVDQEKGSVTSLYKLLPGAQAAAHRHEGIEQCYVLEGDFQVNEEVLGPGDFTCAMTGSTHEIVRTTHGTLLLIVAQTGYEMLSAH